VGLVSGARRRVAGLRRGELVKVAGVSAEYDLRLEMSGGKMEQTPPKETSISWLPISWSWQPSWVRSAEQL
jgi:hypothetical protein